MKHVIRNVASYSSPLCMKGNYKTCDNHLSSPYTTNLNYFETRSCTCTRGGPFFPANALRHDRASRLLISPWWQFIRPLFPPLKEWVSCTEFICEAFISACLSKVTFSHMYDCGMTVDCDINVGYESGHERAGAAGAQSRLRCVREG